MLLLKLYRSKSCRLREKSFRKKRKKAMQLLTALALAGMLSLTPIESYASVFAVGSDQPAPNNSLSSFFSNQPLTGYEFVFLTTNDSSLSNQVLGSSGLFLGAEAPGAIITQSEPTAEPGGIFQFTENIGLILQNIAFTGSEYLIPTENAMGKVIYAAKDLSITLSKAVFSNNIASAEKKENTAHGGAIYANGKLEIVGSDLEFTDNRATVGILFDSGSSTGSSKGGAIYHNPESEAIFACSNLIFHNNSAGTNSYSYSQDSTGSGQGGAIYGGTLYFGNNNMIFSNNSVSPNKSLIGSDYTGLGGAIKGKDMLFVNNNMLFSQNEAYGGKALNLNAKNAGQGGAIHADNLTIFGGTAVFEKNEAYGGGNSAPDFLAPNETETDGTVYDTSPGTARGLGGAIYADKSASFSNGHFTFTDNIAHSVYFVGVSREAQQTGQGGAVYVKGPVTFAEGIFEFAGNKANGNSISFTGDGESSHAAHGGAIYASGTAAFGNGLFTFSKNSANGGEAYNGWPSATSGPSTHHSGHGGAIYAASQEATSPGSSSIFFANGVFKFIENQATGGNVKDFGDSSNSGHGGAIYVSGTQGSAVNTSNRGLLTFLCGDFEFTKNSAIGGSATTPGNYASAYDSGHGGAIYSEDIRFDSGRFVFNANTAKSGDIIDGGSVSGSGKGGAIYSYGHTIFNNGEYYFTDNQAIGGSAITSGFSNETGYGGALYGYDITFNNGAYLFKDNKANGKESAIYGFNAQSGYGGAIYAENQATFNDGKFLFINNIASGGNLSQEESSSLNSGRGGAIYAANGLDFTHGAYLFKGNIATGGNVTTGGNAESSGLGGAIYSKNGATFHNGFYIFEDNIAKSGDVNRGTDSSGNPYLASSVASGIGGAIYSSGDTVFENGAYIFARNIADAGKTNALSYNSGLGGAIYANNAIFNDGIYYITGNVAEGTQVATGTTGIPSSGQGGALYVSNSATFNGGFFRISENIARTSDIAGYSGTPQSGLGGAIYAEQGVTFNNGTYEFAFNEAQGGNASNGASTDFSGQGGAIYTNGLTINNGNHLFFGNKALSGAIDGDSSTSKMSGLGGAIFARGDVSMHGNMYFINNTAGAIDPSKADTLSGYGGAIYHTPSPASGSFTLHTTKDNSIVMFGNMQKNDQPNDIYFGNLTADDNVTTATFNTEKDSLLATLSGIASQKNNLPGLNNLYLTINKTGEGTWKLGGESDLGSRTNLNILEGRFEMAPTAVLHLSAGEMNANSMVVASGATFSPSLTADGMISKLYMNGHNDAASTLEFAPGAKLEPVGLSTLPAGNHKYDDAIIPTHTAVSIDPGFKLENQLVTAQYKNAGNNYDFIVSNLKNMSETFGLAAVVDEMRTITTLDPATRAAFEHSYLTGTNALSADTLKVAHSLQKSSMFTAANTATNMIGSNFMQISKDFSDLHQLQMHNTLGSFVNAGWTEASAQLAAPSFSAERAVFNKSDWNKLNGEQANLLESPNQLANALGVDGSRVFGFNGPSSGLSFWMHNDSSIHSRSNADQYGAGFSPYSLTMGTTYYSDKLVAGVASQFNEGTMDQRNSALHMDNDLSGWNYGAFTGYYDDHFYARAGAQYGETQNENTTKYTGIGAGKAKYTNTYWGADFETGYKLDLDESYSLTPHVGFSYSQISTPEFTEKGTAPYLRHAAASDWTRIEAPVGLRFDGAFETESQTKLGARLDVSYIPNMGELAPETDFNFINSHSSGWTVKGDKMDRHAVGIGAGLSLQTSENVFLGLDYDSRIGQTTNDHNVTARFAIPF